MYSYGMGNFLIFSILLLLQEKKLVLIHYTDFVSHL